MGKELCTLGNGTASFLDTRLATYLSPFRLQLSWNPQVAIFRRSLLSY